MNGNVIKLAEQDESVIRNLGIPYTIIRTGSLKNTPGGKQGFSFKEGSAAQGTLSKEDTAFICVEALDTVPKQGLTFECHLWKLGSTNNYLYSTKWVSPTIMRTYEH